MGTAICTMYGGFFSSRDLVWNYGIAPGGLGRRSPGWKDPALRSTLAPREPQNMERELTSGKTHLLRAVTFATPKPDLSTACCYLDRDQLGKISIATKGTNEDLEQVRVATVSLPMVQQQAVNTPAGEQDRAKDEKKKKRGKKRKKEDISMETETRDGKGPSSPVQVRWDEAGCAAALPGLEEQSRQVQFTCDSVTCLAFGTHKMEAVLVAGVRYDRDIRTPSLPRRLSVVPCLDSGR
ncbi:Hypp1573 [Branchiostoma lanceolatum]|uniref:Hypp1573 protein n=1 Tax=Branchiostoma lanceolatum TaxID=7740 RepID=A0A8K0ELG9_BRALA|nr:Hypp1573 [Branchiostoma lanceolatum]